MLIASPKRLPARDILTESVIKYNTADTIPPTIYKEFCNLRGLILYHVSTHSIDPVLLLAVPLHT